MLQELGKVLIENNLTISSAESLTGGLFGAKLCEVSGISKVYKGSMVTYQDEVKIHLLNVNEDTIDKYGAVSLECAYEMVKNVQKIFNTNIAVSFTGNAGPNPSEGKAVGLVFIGLSFNNDIEVFELNLKGSREEIRNECLKFVSRKLLKKLEKF